MGILSEISTRAPRELDKKEIKAETEKLQSELCDLQNVLYAESKYSVLIILQGMDASGKDGAINKVFNNVNPQGVSVKPYKAPTELELTHHFLWRIHHNTPPRGMIMIFNRSHYEDVLITRVHNWCDDKTAALRFEAINNFEELLTLHNNTLIFKFYLHISQEEQQERLKDRLNDETKHWKYNKKDFDESKLWDKYMEMYEDVFEKCNAIPWVIVPSDQNWYKEYIITKTLVTALKELNMEYPKINGKKD
ncbi:MAG: PPK2 family polyphosphate kinase [Flavisolibacter sp.]